MKINEIIHGFKLISQEEIGEIQSIGRVFEHVKTGARLVSIQNDDTNKVFYVGFRTPSKNSTGVAHILEHSVLCGSQKYPLKEPFVELIKGSLNTFLNAMTYPDKTVYPVASTNDKDFKNLMDVYMDAVFFPNIYDNAYVFQQEGWHYHLENKDDAIYYNGVVYNEMKGVYSNPEEILDSAMSSALFPDTIYGYESGGHPEHIIDLTYEDFINFHSNFYHPANAYLYLYGDLDLEERLAYLDREYLSKFEEKEVDSRIDKQSPLHHMVEREVAYPVAETVQEANRDYISVGYVFDLNQNVTTITGLEILLKFLLDSNVSPLKKELLDLKIAEDIEYSFSTPLKQPVLTITFKNSKIEHKETIINTIDQVFEELYRKGIDRELLKARLQASEFETIEAEFGNYPKGLIFGLNMLELWLYGGNPFSYLKYRSIYAELKKWMDSNGFEELLKEKLLDNRHRAVVTMRPDENLGRQQEDALKEKLQAYKESLSDLELQQLLDENQKLIEFQTETDSPEALATIPKLSLNEIEKEAKTYRMDEVISQNAYDIFYYHSTGENIVYYKLIFDTGTLNYENLLYLGMFNKVLTGVSTKKYPYETLDRQMDLYTGGISTNIDIYNDVKNPGRYKGKFTIKGKALYENADHLLELMESIVNESIFNERDLIKDILTEAKLTKKNQLLNSGHIAAAQRLKSYGSQSGRYLELVGGYDFYKQLDDIHWGEEDFERLKLQLQALAKHLFTSRNLTVSITSHPKHKETLIRKTETLTKTLNPGTGKRYAIDLPQTGNNEGIKTSGTVQYVAKGFNILEHGYAYRGELMVLKQLLSMEYLWKQLRVLGGAYGAVFGVSYSGDLYFTSYRDPHLAGTLDVYAKAADFIKNLDIDQKELEKYIIGSISPKEVPVSDAHRSFVAENHYFSGLTEDDLQKERDEMLGCTLASLKDLTVIFDTFNSTNQLCVIGNGDKIMGQKSIFDDLIILD